MPQLTVRLTDERFKKLNKLLEGTLGKDQVANNIMSDNFRLFIDKLSSCRSEKTLQKAVSKHANRKTRRCYRRNNNQVSVAAFCEKCFANSPNEYKKCPAVQKDAGAEEINVPSSGLPFKGAIR